MTEEDKKQNTTQDICEAISAYWSSQEDQEIVQTYGLLLKKATDEGHYLTLQTASEDQSSIPKDDFGRLECKDLEVLLQEQWSLFAWQNPESLMGTSRFNEQIKVTELLRTKDLILRLYVCQPGLKLPQHAKTARELIQILTIKQGQCKASAKIGPIEEWVKDVTKTFYEFLPTAPQVIHVGNEGPLLYLSLWDIRECEEAEPTKFWFSNLTKGDSYSEDIMAIQNVEEYYNKMASDYEESMFGWGYCMPEALSDALVKHGGLKMEASILDLGCGNGLCGQALFNRGIEDINGLDFSSEMLKQCAKRACYTTLQKHDLFQPLPFENDQFDCLLSVAVTTYLNPSVLELWLKVAKPGGLISFTHKTSVWPEWEAEQDRLETQAQWKKVWVSHPIPYLPSLKEQRGDEPCKEMAKVYIYKKL